MDRDDLLDRVRRDDLRLVRFLYCDTSGILRGKNVHAAKLAGHLQAGIGLTRAMMAMNALDQLQPVEGMGAVGEIRLVPDPASFVPVPYAPRTGAMMSDMLDLDGQAWTGCARSALRRQIGRAAQRGCQLVASFEHEFSLIRITDRPAVGGSAGDRPTGAVPPYGMAPYDRSLCFSTQGMNEAAAVIDDIVATLERQGLQVEQYYPELGHGQHELSIAPRPALTAADHCLYVRDTVRAVALHHGLWASLAPKPFPNQAGNGAHVHLSLWSTPAESLDPARAAGSPANLFYDPADRYRLSPLAYAFVAGILEHLPGLVALTCSSVNSYRRLQPSAWSSAFRAWGPDNREAAVRVASVFRGREAESANIEIKCVDGSCNPYLALAGILAAGLDGIDRGLQPGEPLLVDPASLDPNERQQRGIDRLPASLDEALAALAADPVLTEALGPHLGQAYMAVKRSEVAFFADLDPETECRIHAERY